MPDASYLPYFELHLYDEGFVIQMPEKDAPTVVPSFRPQHKLFQVLKESTKWGDIQNIETVGALNDKITGYDPCAGSDAGEEDCGDSGDDCK